MNAIIRNSFLALTVAGTLSLAACKTDDSMETPAPPAESAPPMESTPPVPPDASMTPPTTPPPADTTTEDDTTTPPPQRRPDRAVRTGAVSLGRPRCLGRCPGGQHQATDDLAASRLAAQIPVGFQ
jgi:hypothetical protein